MSKKKSNWKNREGVVYSTSQDFEYTDDARGEETTLPVAKQNLRVTLDKSGRAGKQVTLISGFVGNQSDLDSLTKVLKTKCGVGGSSKEGYILIQGDVRDKVVSVLEKEGYKAKRIG